MPSKGFGWVPWGATGSEPMPTNVRTLNLALSIVANEAGFYWAVNPGREVIKTLATTGKLDVLICHLDVEGVPSGTIQWSEPFVTVDERIPSDRYRLSSDGTTRRLELIAPIDDGVYSFKFRVKYVYQHQRVEPVILDPEIDLGMESPPA